MWFSWSSTQSTPRQGKLRYKPTRKYPRSLINNPIKVTRCWKSETRTRIKCKGRRKLNCHWRRWGKRLGSGTSSKRMKRSSEWSRLTVKTYTPRKRWTSRSWLRSKSNRRKRFIRSSRASTIAQTTSRAHSATLITPKTRRPSLRQCWIQELTRWLQ